MASTSYGKLVTPHDVLATLPNGELLALKSSYTSGETNGVLVLVVISCISASAVTGLLLAIAISAWNTRKSTLPNLFVRSHVAAYFISLLFCDIAQTIGSIMSIRWVQENAVSYEPYCTVQGVAKHLADVGTAYWSLIIAMNTFWILFLRWKLRRFVLISTIVTGWCIIGVIITSGPAAIQRLDAGPFYAISGYWCWISDQYPSYRITLDYLIMFLSAALSFVLYSLVYLRLRGNILVHGWHVSFHLRSDLSDNMPRSIDTYAAGIAKSMLLYPVAYTILLLPIAICRFTEWTGHEVPFAATIFSDAIFLLSGFVNVVLFLTTRRVLPMHSVLPRKVGSMFGSSMTRRYSRGSSHSATSYATDTEKYGLSYQENIHTRGSVALLSAPPSATPTQYTAASPLFTIGPAASETYGQISQDGVEANRCSFDEVDIASTPYYGNYRQTHTESPSVTIAIPSRALSAVYLHDTSPSRSHPSYEGRM